MFYKSIGSKKMSFNAWNKAEDPQLYNIRVRDLETLSPKWNIRVLLPRPLPDPPYILTHPNPHHLLLSLENRYLNNNDNKEKEEEEELKTNGPEWDKTNSKRKSMRNTYRCRDTYIATYRSPLKMQNWKQ